LLFWRFIPAPRFAFSPQPPPNSPFRHTGRFPSLRLLGGTPADAVYRPAFSCLIQFCSRRKKAACAALPCHRCSVVFFMPVPDLFSAAAVLAVTHLYLPAVYACLATRTRSCYPCCRVPAASQTALPIQYLRPCLRHSSFYPYLLRSVRRKRRRAYAVRPLLARHTCPARMAMGSSHRYHRRGHARLLPTCLHTLPNACPLPRVCCRTLARDSTGRGRLTSPVEPRLLQPVQRGGGAWPLPALAHARITARRAWLPPGISWTTSYSLVLLYL